MSFHRARVAIALLVLGGCFRELDRPPEPGHDPEPMQPQPQPQPTPAPACEYTYLPSNAPILAASTTTGAPIVGGCGVTGPGTLFSWTAPGVGPYTVTVVGAFPLDVEVADGETNLCLGPTVGCAAADGPVGFTTPPGRTIDIAVIARDGVGGPFELTIDGPAPFCGDGTCGFEEDCSSCAEDCGECAPSPTCGDGTCDFDEDCSSCELDCGTCPDCAMAGHDKSSRPVTPASR